MAITPFVADLNIISPLDTEPNDVGGLTPTILKASFDEAGLTIQTYINGSLVPELDAVHLPYIYGDVGGQTIKEALDDAALGEIPDGSITALKLASNAVTTAKILDGNVTLAKLEANIVDLIQNNLLNILRLKLQVSLAASDIDAYSDLFADTSLLNSSTSINAAVTNGSLYAGIYSGPHSSAQNFEDGTYGNIGQTFTPGQSCTVNTVKVNLRRVGASATVSAYIYATSGGVPTSLLYTATNTVATDNVGGDGTFTFSGANVTAGTMYALVFAISTGGVDNCGQIGTSSTNYSAGTMVSANTSDTVWTVRSGDIYFEMTCSTGTAIWTAVTPSEALTYVAVTVNTTPGAGTITWYLSDDGSAWVQITAEDAIQTVSFDAASLYLKCVLTGNATVEAVAYGGY